MSDPVSNPMSDPISDYAAAVSDFRRRKDEHFAAGRGPIAPEALPDFRGLSYHPPDPAWRFVLPLEEVQGDAAAAEFVLDTNTGTPRFMARLGEVAVPLPGGEHRLTVFAPLGEEHPARAFVPFRDRTSGQTTYGAGRYIDAPLRREDGETWVDLDFNLAYHPYCAYGDGWTCPLPPAGNTLPVPVEAGEKLP